MRCLMVVCPLIASAGLQVFAQTAYVEPPLPVTLGAQTGYFPTLVESPLLRGALNSRSLGQFGMNRLELGPDVRAQTATDLFPYQDPEPNFYQRNQNFFNPLDDFFGVFVPNDAATYEMDSLDNTSLTLDARLGFVTRTFSPELATLKAGPLYFDLLWVGAGVLWNDFNGPRNFGSNNGDGWNAYIDLGTRFLLRFTDTIYFSVAANLIYLPFENEVALRFGSGRDVGLLARLNYSETFGPWDVLLFNEFQGRPGLNWWGPATVYNFDRTGRYVFGFLQPGPTNQFFNDNFVWFSNRVGIDATRLVFEGQWRLWLLASHTDIWQTFSFDNHRPQEHLRAMLGYEGSVIPFAPRLSYDLYSNDGYSSQWHIFMLQFTGRVTENVNWLAKVGYLTSAGMRGSPSRFLWEVALDHTITRNTRQMLTVGEGFFNNDVLGESLTSRFIQYRLDQRLGSRLWLEGLVQLSDQETVLNTMQVRERFSTGVRLRYTPLDFTQVLASVLYEQTDQAPPSGDVDRWFYRLEVLQQLNTRMTLNVFYQYEDREATPMSFTEHLVGMTLRRYF